MKWSFNDLRTKMVIQSLLRYFMTPIIEPSMFSCLMSKREMLGRYSLKPLMI